MVEISQKKIVDLLKPVRQMCLSDADLLLPEKLSILREKQLTDGVLQTWILDQLMIHFSDKTAEIVRVHMPKIDCSTVGLVSWDSLRIEGNNRFRFLLTVDEKNFSIGGEFRLFQMIPTLNRSTLVNQKIEASDLEVKKKDVTFLNNYIKKVEDLIGRTLNVSLMAGEPIQMRHLKEEKFVEKGQMVQIQYKTESFVVSAIGIAEQSGTFGDFVKIKNPDSQKVLSAIVSGKGLVEVQ